MHGPGAQPAVQALARLLYYKPVDDFESGADGWTLTGGAKVVDGNAAQHVGGSSDDRSLLLPAGSSATSPPVCVGLNEPTLRYFARKNSGLLSTLTVSVQVQLELGVWVTLPIGVDLGGAWHPSLPSLVVANLLPLLPPDMTAVRFKFAPLLGGLLADRRRLRRSAHVAVTRVSSGRMIDPLERWREYGEKPDYAGLLTFSGMPYTQDAAELAGVDVAIVGAPTDDLVSDRPGTRFGPRGIRAASCPHGPHLEAGIDAMEVLKVVDFGDAPVLPADPVRTHAAIESVVGQVVDAGALPIILGGDHSIAEPDIRAVATRGGGPVGLIHFDTHTDTGQEVFGVELSHGSIMYRLVEQGHVDPTRYVQIGLRGYWPGETEFGWQHEKGITSMFMHDVREFGIRSVIERTLSKVGAGPVFLSVDVDVLDPAFAPGTGTPEPGGMSSADLLWACREICSRVDLVGMDVVEVIPTMVGSADITSLVADRIVREILTGVALRRRR